MRKWRRYQFEVYITMNYERTVLYVGFTGSLKNRIIEHYLERGKEETFAGRYNAFWLVYYETFDYVLNARAREKQIKGWKREKKLELIKSKNPNLKFLNEELFGQWPPPEPLLIHRKKYYKDGS